MGIKGKLLLAFLAMVAVPMAFTTIINFNSSRNTLRNEVISAKRLVADGIEGQILEYLESGRRRVAFMADGSYLRDMVAKIDSLKDPALKRAEGRKLSRHLAKNKMPLDPDVINIHILDPAGREIAGTDADQQGSAGDKDQPYFVRGMQTTYIQTPYSHVHGGVEHWFIPVATPIRNSAGDRTIGVLMAGFDIAAIRDILSGKRSKRFGALTTAQENLGSTEISLINNDGRIIAQSTHGAPNDSQNMLPGSVPARDCLEKGKEASGAWTDHKGRNVWGATMCLQPEKDWRWVLVVTRDEAAAMLPISKLGNITVLLLAVTLLIVGITALSLANSLSRPIRELQKGTEIIGTGALDHTVGTDAGDEIGMLSRAIDRMSQNLKSVTISRDELDREMQVRRTSEEELRRSEERLRKVIEYSPMPMAITDEEQNILLLNENFHRIIGYTAEDIPTVKEWWPLAYPDETYRMKVAEQWRRYLEQSAQSGAIPQAEYDVTCKDGNIRTFEIFGAPIGDRFLIVFQDITSRKAAERALQESEERFRSAFEQAAVGIAHVGTDGAWLRVNERLCEIVGYTEEELLALTFQDITHPEDLDKDLEYVRQMLAGEIESYSMEKRYLRKDRSVVWVNLTVSLMREPDGAPKYFISVVEDISARKDAETRLKNSLLDVERSNKELEQFAYVASHDLQEPLRMVSSYVQLLAQDYGDRLDGEAEEYMNYAVDGAKRMQAMINDLLAYSRVGTRGTPMERIDSNLVLSKALENLRLIIEESGVKIDSAELPTVFADPSQLVQLFQNLIGNAIKYRDKTTPHIRISAHQEKSEWVFSIQDNGIGFNPKYKDRIFMIFQRLHGKGTYEGSGIGLAVCKKIVERHNGRIWAESEPGKGSTFYFSLPSKS